MDGRAGGRFGVWNDYGKLREVAVGTTEGWRFPRTSPLYPVEDFPELTRLTDMYGGLLVSEVEEYAESLAELDNQLDRLAAVYEQHGVIVHRPRPISDDEWRLTTAREDGGSYPIYPADAIWIIGRNVVECRFREEARQRELFALRDLITPMADGAPDARWGSCPVAAPAADPLGAKGPFLEGGDIFICGDDARNVLVGIDERRSSSASGVRWLAKFLAEDGYTVTGVPILPGAPIHLLAALACVGPERALIYRPSLRDGIPEPITHWDLIDVSLEETATTGPCVVMLDEQTVVVCAEAPRIADALDRRGLEVITVPMDKVSLWDGGVRCSTFVMRRDP